MTKEDKIIEMLGNLQNDMATLKADVEILKNAGRVYGSTTQDDWDTFEKMSKLLTKEEADNLAEIISAQKAGISA